MEVAHSFSSGFCLCGYLQFTPMKRYEFFCCTIFYNLSYLNGDLSAENQEKVADDYVAGRYGSWSAAKTFWLANGWY